MLQATRRLPIVVKTRGGQQPGATTRMTLVTR
jgi:hypothetical protein